MLDDWDTRFPGCPPVGHLLRTAFPRRWVRFHSLPESKRYPESRFEYEVLLGRHDTVLGELTPPGSRVVLVTTGYTETPEPARSYEELLSLDPSAAPWRSIDLEDDGYYSHFHTSRWTWGPGVFDHILRLVASGRLGNILIVAPDCRWVLHPYDGGMDVILESEVARDALKACHADWLSSHPDGL